jgi:hypothetical protein
MKTRIYFFLNSISSQFWSALVQSKGTKTIYINSIRKNLIIGRFIQNMCLGSRFYTPIKLQKKNAFKARASSDLSFIWIWNITFIIMWALHNQSYCNISMKNWSNVECILLKFHWGMKALIELHFQHEALPRFIENVLRSTLSYPNETSKDYIKVLYHNRQGWVVRPQGLLFENR